MSMGVVWFVVGMISGMIAMVVISCVMAVSNTDDEYEQWKNSEYRNETEKKHEKID